MPLEVACTDVLLSRRPDLETENQSSRTTGSDGAIRVSLELHLSDYGLSVSFRLPPISKGLCHKPGDIRRSYLSVGRLHPRIGANHVEF